MPKTSKAFQAVRPGDVYPSEVPAGEEVSGRLAVIAAALGALEAPAPIEPVKPATGPVRATRAAKRAPETKA